MIWSKDRGQVSVSQWTSMSTKYIGYLAIICGLGLLWMSNEVDCLPGGSYIALSTRSSRRYCGQRLVDVLSLLCKSNYNKPSKKSFADYQPAAPSTDVWWKKDRNDLNFFLPEEVAMALIKPDTALKRRKRGVYDECCLKQCSTNELRGYCANP